MYKLINYNLIEDYLKENRLTQKEFCKECKISLSSLHKMKYGANDFMMETIHKVGKTINCKIYELINEDESKRMLENYYVNKNKKERK